MKKTRSLLLAVALIVSITAAIALAVKERPDRIGPGGNLGGPAMQRPLLGGDPVDRIRRVLMRLDLTDTQKEKVKGILEANKEGMKQAQEARVAAIKAFGQAVEAGDEAAIRAAGTGVGNAMANGAVIRSQVKAAVKAMLTPEQLAKLEEMKDRAKQSMGRRLGDRAGRPGLDRANPPGKVVRAGALGRLGDEKVFNRIDRNDDGVITLRELKAFQRQNGKERPGPRDRELD